MKQIFSILCLLTLACSNPEAPVTATVSNASYSIDSFLSKFKDIEFDSLKVYTSDQIDADTSFYKGYALDSMDARYIANIYGDMAFDSSRAYLSQFYACYKFKIDEERTGLIIRCPSEYVSSFLDVFEYNRKTGKVVHVINLSELWGDAGDVYERCSYLFKSGKGLGVYQFNYSAYDHSAEDEKDTTVEEWYTHYKLNLVYKGNDTLYSDTGHYQPYWMKR